MIQKKICLLGSFAVGKTSLTSRFVHSLFSDKYLTTIGVKVSKKVLQIRTEECILVIWDRAGEDEFQAVEAAYLRGASGYLLVADGTRRATLEQAVALQEKAVAAVGRVPFRLLPNKADLQDDWEVEESALAELSARGWVCQPTSAKTGAGVEAAFLGLAERMMGGLGDGC